MFSQHEYYEQVNENKYPLERVEIDNQRFYRDSEGLLYKSVTTFLGKFNNSSIEDWRNRVGHAQADEICRLAARKGTNIHLACEKFLNNEADYKKHLFYHEMMDWKILEPVLQKRVNKIVAQELQMCSKHIQLAGTVDCIAELDGVLSIIDFKTSSRDKQVKDIPLYWLQCAAYAVMVYELYGIRINQLSIIMIVNHSHVNVYSEPAVKWIKRLKRAIEIKGI